MERYELKHGGNVSLVTKEEAAQRDVVVFEVFIFKSTGEYHDTIYFMLENMTRTELSFLRRIDKENPKYFQIYNDFITILKSRSFFKDYILVANCIEYYPALLFPVDEETTVTASNLATAGLKF